MCEYEILINKVVIVKSGDAIFSDGATSISIADEAGGEFVVVEQHDNGRGSIAIDPNEWPIFRQAIDDMVARCRA